MVDKAKDIQASEEALNEFNRTVRESIDLSKDLSKAMNKLPESLKLSVNLNKDLSRDISEYRDSLLGVERLSKRIANGRVKDRDIINQISELEKRYNNYVEENSTSFEKRGRFLTKQRELQKEIANLEIGELARKRQVARVDENIDALLHERIKQEKVVNSKTALNEKRRWSKARVEELDELIKGEEETIKFYDRQSKSSDKLISQKKEEKGQLDGIVKDNDKIVKGYEDQISKARILLEANRKSKIESKLTSNDFGEFIAGFKSLAPLFAPLTAIFQTIKGFAFGISDQVTKLQKNLVLSKTEGYEVRNTFNEMAVSSGDIAVNTGRLLEANAALGTQLGFNSEFTKDLNIQFVKLTKQIGLSEEAAGGLAKLSISTGISLEEAKNVALQTSQRLSSQYGIQLNQRDVLEEIGKLSGQTLAMFKASPVALAEAVAQSRLLGINLETVKNQAKFLLNFESSIEAELQAELLTGRQMNLERARSAALSGDLTTAMKELNNQNIDFNKFSNMNVIAQDKVAAALGLSSDELSNQLLKQQYLGKSREQIASLAGEEVAKRLEALSAQDKFNLATEKMKDIVASLAAPLGKVADFIASMAEHSGILYGTLGLIAGVSLVKLVGGLAASAMQMSILTAGAITTTTALTMGLGAIAIAAGIGVAMGAFAKAKEDATKPLAEGGLLYGPANVLAGEYPGARSNPEVIAPLSDLQNIINKNRAVVNDNNSQEATTLLSAIHDTMKSVKEGIKQLNSRQGTVNIDGQRAGTAQLMGNYNLA